MKQGRLDVKYNGIKDCIMKTLNNEGFASFWRGNFASVLRYFPQQAKPSLFKVFIMQSLIPL